MNRLNDAWCIKWTNSLVEFHKWISIDVTTSIYSCFEERPLMAKSGYSKKKKKENNDITLQKVISFTIPVVALLPEVVTELI